MLGVNNFIISSFVLSLVLAQNPNSNSDFGNGGQANIRLNDPPQPQNNFNRQSGSRNVPNFNLRYDPNIRQSRGSGFGRNDPNGRFVQHQNLNNNGNLDRDRNNANYRKFPDQAYPNNYDYNRDTNYKQHGTPSNNYISVDPYASQYLNGEIDPINSNGDNKYYGPTPIDENYQNVPSDYNYYNNDKHGNSKDQRYNNPAYEDGENDGGVEGINQIQGSINNVANNNKNNAMPNSSGTRNSEYDNLKSNDYSTDTIKKPENESERGDITLPNQPGLDTIALDSSTNRINPSIPLKNSA